MIGQLSLFDTQATTAERLKHLMGTRALNFIWWCRHGNRTMCAAVLVREHHLATSEAQELVAAAAQLEILDA